MFVWNKFYETGIEIIDEQHLELVSIINEYGSMLSEGKTHDKVDSILNKLLNYAEFHFLEEEQMMLEFKVYHKHSEQHKMCHTLFVKDVLDMSILLSNDDISFSKRLLDFSIHWLAYHMLGFDKSMCRQIESIQNGMSPKQAYEIENDKSDDSVKPLVEGLTRLFIELSERSHALIMSNKNLEDKVIERTNELTEANIKLKNLSETDSLTHLPNRRFAIRKLKELWGNEHTKIVCMIIDVDNFKAVNDTHGHDSGDFVLKQVSNILKDNFRSDDFVCRLGGDEFIVLCNNTNLETGVKIAEEVRFKISCLSIGINGVIWNGSVSIGVSEKNKSMLNYMELIKIADESVYISKKLGRNKVSSLQFSS